MFSRMWPRKVTLNAQYVRYACDKVGHNAQTCFLLRDVLTRKLPVSSTMVAQCNESQTEDTSCSSFLDTGASHHNTPD